MWLIMTNENYDTPELRMMVFCRAFHNRLAAKRLRAARRPAALHGVSNRRRRTQFYAVPGAATPADKVKK